MACAGCGGGAAKDSDSNVGFPVRYPNGTERTFSGAAAANSAVRRYGAQHLSRGLRTEAEETPKPRSKRERKNEEAPIEPADESAGAPSE